MNRPLLTQALGYWLPSQVNQMLQQHLGARMAGQLQPCKFGVSNAKIKELSHIADDASGPQNSASLSITVFPSRCQYSNNVILATPNLRHAKDDCYNTGL